MVKSTLASKPAQSTENVKTPSADDKLKQPANQGGQFVTMALNMSWQLAAVVLLPIYAGGQLDKAFGTNYDYTFAGLGVALIGSAAVMWRAMQAANKLPVPKVSAARKRAIKKAYDEEDKDE